MATERAAISGISSRRSACDRCRAQKLRCPRDSSQHEPCFRCTRSKVACITSPIYRIRHSNPWRRLANASSPILISGTGLNASEVSVSDNTKLWSIGPQWQPSDSSACTGDNSQFAPPVSNSFSATTFDSTGPVTPSLSGDFISPLSKQVPTSTIESDQRGHIFSLGWDHGDALPESFANSLAGSTESPGSPETEIAEDISTADISIVNVNLCRQWEKIRDPISTTLTLEMLVAPLAEPHSDHPCGVLKVTSNFLRALRSLARRQSCQSEQPKNHGPPWNIPGVKTFNDVDSATSLLLLSSYIYLLKIYNAQFETICDLLQGVAHSGFPSIDPIHGRSVSGGQSFMGQSGHLQATLFVQMTTNLFEQVERLLGIPFEFRIDRNSRNGGGLLSSEGFDGIMAITMGKETLTSKGGIHTLRHNVRMAHELLRDHIPPY